MLINLETSPYWASIKKAVDELHVDKKTIKSESGREGLQDAIFQIALDNRLVGGIILS